MSAGSYLRSRYTSDDGEVHPIRVQPETVALTIDGTANTAPTGSITSPISARVSGSRRGIGLKSRMVTVVFSAAPPTGYKADSPIALPWLEQSTFSGISRGDTGTYLGQAVEVLSKSPEQVR